MVELLTPHTQMRVMPASEGMRVMPNTIYAIPAGVYLSVQDGALHLSAPDAAHGARLPFDFLLRSLAEEYGERAMGVVLSGTGADGSLGLVAIRQHGGTTIAQRPEEAEYPGMPTAAIAAGGVEAVLSIAEMPRAFGAFNNDLAGRVLAAGPPAPPAGRTIAAALQEIVGLLRSTSSHDFSLYKPGTLQRRIERRIGLVGLPVGAAEPYLERLRSTPSEVELLAKDLLIHVTQFFRDGKVFDHLAQTTIPALVRSCETAQKLRVWVAGCSTGEEAYSLAMLFQEEIARTGVAVKLQMFASDIDADAIATARDGLYPETISAQISPARLARFFEVERGGYRVHADLRGCVVFTVQDVLTDPPFSRLDMISCRNMLIYLQPEAQARVISLFDFALRREGVLLLGSAEAIDLAQHGHFAVMDKSARLYLHQTSGRAGGIDLMALPGDKGGQAPRPVPITAPAAKISLAQACRRLVLEAYAPAAILINARHEVLFSLGPVDRYLRLASGQPSHDVFALARSGMRAPLRQAIEAAEAGQMRVISGGHVTLQGEVRAFNIEIHPLPADLPGLFLLCCVETRVFPALPAAVDDDVARPLRVAELERELEAMRGELHSAIHNLEVSGEEQAAVNQEAQSVNEEYQSTHEELLASKEELQSLNEELTALNGQLQETLERQRATANDLKNVLYSTDVATLFLDLDLKIRFFTPATRALFHVIPTDIGRPLADLNSLAIDRTLGEDARAVIAGQTAREREIRMPDGIWFSRRVLPYRTHEHEIAGVVITFTDVTERKLAAKALVARQDEVLASVSAMLNALLDINEIETGSVNAELQAFALSELLARMQHEFSFQVEAQGLLSRVVECGAMVCSDPRLLAQLLRNLLSNVMKYTKKGKVLLGCRRQGDRIRIEVLDTGVGIPELEQHAIFREYHQLGNAARQRTRGLGLGLAIVQRLADFLGHKVRVRSVFGRGSCFSIELPIVLREAPAEEWVAMPVAAIERPIVAQAAQILLIEDDPSVRDLLTLLLTEAGHAVTPVPGGREALAVITSMALMPDLILTDYHLPDGFNGAGLAARLRETLGGGVPAIVLTGDISKDTLRQIAENGCVQLNKPIKPAALMAMIERLLRQSELARPAAVETARPAAVAPVRAAAKAGSAVHVIDDDAGVRAAIQLVLEQEGYQVCSYESAEEFLEMGGQLLEGCLLVDAYLPGLSGLELLARLGAHLQVLPAIMITGQSDVALAVQAMKGGAIDFIDKPVSAAALVAVVALALERGRDATKMVAWHQDAAKHIAALTARQRQIMDMVLAGHPSKNIAADLGISQRTVENHRASIMRRTGVKSLPALARLALAAVDDTAVGED